MWHRHPTIARLLIWLAAIAFPVQGMPVAMCGCVDGMTCPVSGEQPSACCQSYSTKSCRCTGASICHCGEGSCCRSTVRPGSTASQVNQGSCKVRGSFDEATCSCGVNCRCGQLPEPTPPATPIPAESQPLKLVQEFMATVCLGEFDPPQTKLPAPFASVSHAAHVERTRCVLLCRFTI
jgi:hypothetical protein